MNTMNEPIQERNHFSCNSVGSGNFLRETIQFDIKKPSTSSNVIQDKIVTEKTFVDKLELVRSNDLKKPRKTSFSDSITSCTAACSISTDGSSADFNIFDDVELVKKKVRFQTDRRGRIITHARRNRNPRTVQEEIDCWYTPDEFTQFRRECKKEAILTKKTSYAENFAKVYEACNKGSFKGVTKERAYISAASCRGLEVVLYPVLHANRKNTIQTVLNTQNALPDCVTWEQRVEALASASRFLSKQSRQLARVLGSGDAAVVVANNRIEAARSGNNNNNNKDDSNASTPSKTSSTSKNTVPQCYSS